VNYKLLPVGDRAPDFAATTNHGRQLRLSEQLQRGHVVLIFYPGNNTPG
jgi:peroxiredoxin